MTDQMPDWALPPDGLDVEAAQGDACRQVRMALRGNTAGRQAPTLAGAAAAIRAALARGGR
jgi:hypothetical protein